MIKGRNIKNPSWINENGEYDTVFDLPKEWSHLLNKIDLSKVEQFLNKELETYGDDLAIYPPKNQVWNAFKLTTPDNLKVVILGQDPYINEGEAMGLAFSVPEGIKLPRTLRNIFKKIHKKTNNGDLTSWAKQGVLLLNTSLTVREHISNSHRIYWKTITNSIIKYISDNFQNIVFILWGGNAFEKKEWIDGNKHSILISSHPSPLGCSKPLKGNPSFNDCDHFNECNKILGLNSILF